MRAALAGVVLAAAVATPAGAGLPCLVDGAGTPLRWRMPVGYNLDGGAAAVDGAALVAAATAAWTAVDTAAVSFAAGPPSPETIDARNGADVIARCGDGRSPIVFDPSGELTDALLGEGASQVVLGVTFHDCGTDAAPEITEASVVINGAVFGFAGAAARATQVQVLAHELGHVLNLCHSRLHGAFVDDGDAANDAFVPLMFPSHSADGAAPDPSPRFDDRAMLAALYPAPGLAATHGSLGGHVLAGAAGLAVSGAPIVVRRIDDPLATAEWTTSGWLRLEGGGDVGVPVGEVVPAIDGSWQAPALPPGAYTVEVGAGVAGVPGEFFSGDAESGDPLADPPDLAVPVLATAGVDRTDVTVRLAERVHSPLGETDWDIAWRARLVARGQSQRLPADFVPPGRIELRSTGAYVVTPLAALGGRWRARGRRGARFTLDAGAVESLFVGGGTALVVRRVSGRGAADGGLRRIRGAIVVRARLLAPSRVAFRLVLRYRGTRHGAAGAPGRVPLIPTS
jgi:hypothetical protein